MVIGITAPTGGKIEESGEEQHVGGPEGLLGPLSCLCPPTLKAVASGASSLYFGGGVAGQWGGIAPGLEGTLPPPQVTRC